MPPRRRRRAVLRAVAALPSPSEKERKPSHSHLRTPCLRATDNQPASQPCHGGKGHSSRWG